MDFQILISNITNPTLLFFLLGIIAVTIKSDLQIPESSSKFISLYLLFAIGFKGGQELAHSEYSAEITYTLLFGVAMASVVPAYTFFILKRKLSSSYSGAIAAAYGSVSAVTFVAAVSFLEMQQISYGGHMVAVMALMESPAIVIGVIMMMMFGNESAKEVNWKSIIQHSFTNGSVVMILGSLII
ncbi:MAG TPA: sodium-dependent bicarbonate transport family permease, partial [Ignavibacteriaceae bacterium]